MTPVDPDIERQRLVAYYAGLPEGELRAVAADLNSLTDTAQQALKDELARRRLAVPIPKPTTGSASPAGAIPHPRLVTVQEFVHWDEAVLAKGILNSAGLDCYLADENIVRTDWFLSNAVGGVKLWVREEDRAAAAELINQAQLKDFQVEGIGEYKQPKCPACGSLDIYYKDLGGHNFLARWFFNQYPNTEPGWRCNSCGNRWEETEPDSDSD